MREQANNPGFVAANQLTTQSKKIKKFTFAHLVFRSISEAPKVLNWLEKH